MQWSGVGALYRELRERDAHSLSNMFEASKKYQGTVAWLNLAKLIRLSSQSKVHPDYPLGEGKNARFAIGPNTKIYDENSANWQGRAAYAEVSGLYQRLPPDLQQAISQIARQLRARKPR